MAEPRVGQILQIPTSIVDLNCLLSWDSKGGGGRFTKRAEQVSLPFESHETANRERDCKGDQGAKPPAGSLNSTWGWTTSFSRS